MSEVLRLIGLSQDGALMPVIMVGVGVWLTMSVRQLRTDMATLKDDHRRLETRMEKLADGLAKLASDVSQLRADVAFLRGKAEQG